MLRPARADELAALSALCLRSKAVWGYDRAFLEACRNELTLAPSDLSETSIRVAELDGEVVGVVQVSVEGAVAHLEKLFVEPSALRAGTGRLLFGWAVIVAREHSASVLVVESDPGAVPFYRAMGARDDGNAPSGSIAGRSLPRLTLSL